jgi:hypothetical protein
MASVTYAVAVARQAANRREDRDASEVIALTMSR